MERLAGGLGTSLLALFTSAGLTVVAVASLAGVGLLLLPFMLSLVRLVAERERGRLNRWQYQVISPYADTRPTGWAARLRAAASDPATWRDLRWLASHASLGLLLGLAGVVLPIIAVRDASFPLWWWLLPIEEAGASLGFPVRTWPAVLAVSLMGISWAAILIGLGPAMARLQALPGVRLLRPHPSADLSQRIAQLTVTRASALQAHAAELRRIERALHDGTQNRIIGVAVLLGVARDAVVRDPASAEAALERAQSAAEQALGELRTVIRGILPPVLEERGLAGALTSLAADCLVPCEVTVTELGHLPVAVETTAYFIAAEALTNTARHSRATTAAVSVNRVGDLLSVHVRDDGIGGAAVSAGSGLTGIRRRVEAHDGTITLTSPIGGPTVLEVELPCAS
ncbi:sensor histidine kinase [Microtetraspora malaysiensis]|uniref:sensor histidine kinase n=1 Tax=Microtetraspora malaysiensis TaxID=161358 RepID=UPI000AD0EF22|nr:sensor histidine kinase [Microtetraspora malaysiensis]